MNLHPSRATTITIEDIKRHYAGSGHVPTSKSLLNSMMREQLIQLKELLAFSEMLIERGKAQDDGFLDACQSVVAPLQEYLDGIDRKGGYKAKAG